MDSTLILCHRIYHLGNRTYLFDIDFWHLKTSKDWVVKYCVDGFHVGNVSPGRIDGNVRVLTDVMRFTVHKILSKSFSERLEQSP